MKDCSTCKYGFVDEQFGFPMCHHPLRFSEDCVDFNMHEEKEEPEKTIGIEEKKLPEDLEEGQKNPYELHNVSHAAHEYERTRNDTDARSDNEIVRRAFIAGAKWQAEKDKEIIELAEDHAMLAGMDKMKEEMMEKAVEGRVSAYDNGKIRIYTELLDGDIGFNFGDKVKVIVIPKEK